MLDFYSICVVIYRYYLLDRQMKYEITYNNI